MLRNAELPREQGVRPSAFARLQTLTAGQVLCTLLLIIVACVAVYPILQIILQSFQTSRPGEEAQWSLDG